jgi:hypothetical protein
MAAVRRARLILGLALLAGCTAPETNLMAPLNPAPSMRYPRSIAGEHQCLDDGIRAIAFYFHGTPLSDVQQVQYAMGVAYVCDRVDPSAPDTVKTMAAAFAAKTGADEAALAAGAADAYRQSYAIDARPYDIIMN